MPRHDVLWQRLESARPPELRKLADVLGTAEADHKPQPVLVEELSRDIRAAAGHSVLNWLRGPHDFPYKQLLIDVADKMAPGWTPLSWTSYRLGDRHTELDVEETVWSYFDQRVRDRIRGLTAEQRERLRADTEAELRRLGYGEALVSPVGAGLAAGTTATVVAPALAYHIALSTASGLAWLKLWWVGHASAAAVLGTGGVLFAVLYAPGLVWWLGNTAYRKTIPAALHLIQVRKLREIEGQLG
jgi:hypothetical protein